MDLVRLTSFIVIIMTFSACSAVEPHTNFKQMLAGGVGENIDEQSKPGRLVGDRKEVKEEKLSNGNIERTYIFSNRKECEYALEFNPVSRKIMNARIVKGERDCYVTP
jgi:hypothetical protein